MSSLGSRSIATVSVGLLVGAGWFLVEKRSLEAKIADGEAQLAKGGGTSFSKPAAQVAQAVATGAKSTAPAPVSMPSVVYGAAPAAKRTANTPVTPRTQDLAGLLDSGVLGQLRWAPSTASGDLTATINSLVEILELSPSETDALRASLEGSKQAITAGILAASTVTRRSDDEVVITVKDSSDAKIAAIKMHDSVKQILGEQRYNIYEGLGAKAAIDNVFTNNGLNASTITLTRSYNEARQMNSYSMSRRSAANGGGGSSTMPRESLPMNMGPLGALLPADF